MVGQSIGEGMDALSMWKYIQCNTAQPQKNEIVPFAEAWMDLDIVNTLIEVRQENII